MTDFFPQIKGRLGFGMMRLPMQDKKIDLETSKKMVDAFIEAGFNYFDTAHGYHDGLSEPAVRECVTKRYPRDKYILTDKLTDAYFKTNADIRPYFEKQLRLCGVDYFDFYLLHAVGKNNIEHYERCKAFEAALELKREGKVRHVGFSFHDSAQMLDELLTKYPMMELVQLQINYADYESESVQSRKCLEVCKKHSMPVIVMEPVKGGRLANLPENAHRCFSALGDSSDASYAIRFAAGLENVMLVLSGMSDMLQMSDNISHMKDFKPLSEAELNAVWQACEQLKGVEQIACTACRYCIDRCPKHIAIADLFACYNTKRMFNDWNQDYYYNNIHTSKGTRASDCIGCGNCEKTCPQHLEIRKLLKTVAKEFEK